MPSTTTRQRRTSAPAVFGVGAEPVTAEAIAADATAMVPVEGLDQMINIARQLGTCVLRVAMPATAAAQTEAGEPWYVVRGARIEGERFLPLVGCNAAGYYLLAVDGRIQPATAAFLERYVIDGTAYLTEAAICNILGVVKRVHDVAATLGEAIAA
ncbi:hypothetical protein LQK89_02630 [Curtobacterium sp. C1]|uniref:hypothetical protein n=1 Tax=Curtobacterium sp. C1 TaxID=2898151 RepID=UPI001E3CA31C|nr:hypothetical protein [Curtobacterium sp. C1]UFU14614.1 hypothetical protein LQK89_02630 [Curtobacterium sp. C1]